MKLLRGKKFCVDTPKKKLTLVFCILMTIVAIVSGIMAYLTAKDSNASSFEFGELSIDLDESVSRYFKLMPGFTYRKDPTVTVKGGSVACWLFIRAVEENNTFEGLDGKLVVWTVIEDEWTPVPGQPDYWYREVPACKEDTLFCILTGNDEYEDGFVHVNEALTGDMMDFMESDQGSGLPTLSFQAAAVQRHKVDTVEYAWTLLSDDFKGVS